MFVYYLVLISFLVESVVFYEKNYLSFQVTKNNDKCFFVDPMEEENAIVNVYLTTENIGAYQTLRNGNGGEKISYVLIVYSADGTQLKREVVPETQVLFRVSFIAEQGVEYFVCLKLFNFPKDVGLVSRIEFVYNDNADSDSGDPDEKVSEEVANKKTLSKLEKGLLGLQNAFYRIEHETEVQFQNQRRFARRVLQFKTAVERMVLFGFFLLLGTIVFEILFVKKFLNKLKLA